MQRARRWQRLSVWAIRLGWIVLLVGTLHAQGLDGVNRLGNQVIRNTEQIVAIDNALADLKALNLGTRLATIEQTLKDSEKDRALILAGQQRGFDFQYTIIAGLALNFIALYSQYRERRSVEQAAAHGVFMRRKTDHHP